MSRRPRTGNRERRGRLAWGAAALLLTVGLALPSCRAPQRQGTSQAAALPASPPSAMSSPAAPSAAPANPVSDLARREILRRQEMVRRMDAAALEANRALADNDLEGAVGGFRQASSGLP